MTTLSHSAAAVGLAKLAEAWVISWGDGPGARFRGEVLVPDVEALKRQAFLDVWTREIAPLLADRDDDWTCSRPLKRFLPPRDETLSGARSQGWSWPQAARALS